jgi:YgiT-type zinc finger domain-containing protein
MIPDKCSFCKGKLVEGKHEFVVKTGETVLAIRDVDAFICQECGEAYYTSQTSRRIDKVMQKLMILPCVFIQLQREKLAFVR